MYVKVPGMQSIEGLGLLDWWILAGLGQLPLQRSPIPFLPLPPAQAAVLHTLRGPDNFSWGLGLGLKGRWGLQWRSPP